MASMPSGETSSPPSGTENDHRPLDLNTQKSMSCQAKGPVESLQQ